MKILVSDRLDPEAVERLRAAGHEVVESFGLKGPDLAQALRGCQGLMIRGATRVTAEVLRDATELRAVVRAGTGLDNVDLPAARERGVTVLNTPAANAISVAELVFALALALERQLLEAAGDLRGGRWEKTKYMGRELCGRSLGLVGFGRIGREVASRARAFGMTVRAVDPLLPEWPAGFEWVPRVSLDELLPVSQVLSLHVPLAGGTRNLIGARELGLLPKDAILINCARGGVVDEAALHAALEGGALRGAALDVFAVEPPEGSPLLGLPNLIATPHLGASTREAQKRAGLEAADRMIEALAGAAART